MKLAAHEREIRREAERERRRRATRPRVHSRTIDGTTRTRIFVVPCSVMSISACRMYGLAKRSITSRANASRVRARRASARSRRTRRDGETARRVRCSHGLAHRLEPASSATGTDDRVRAVEQPHFALAIRRDVAAQRRFRLSAPANPSRVAQRVVALDREQRDTSRTPSAARHDSRARLRARAASSAMTTPGTMRSTSVLQNVHAVVEPTLEATRRVPSDSASVRTISRSASPLRSISSHGSTMRPRVATVVERRRALVEKARQLAGKRARRRDRRTRRRRRARCRLRWCWRRRARCRIAREREHRVPLVARRERAAERARRRDVVDSAHAPSRPCTASVNSPSCSLSTRIARSCRSTTIATIEPLNIRRAVRLVDEEVGESAQKGARAELHGLLGQIERARRRNVDRELGAPASDATQVARQSRPGVHHSVTPSFQIAISR